MLVDTNGVGYELQAPMTTFFSLPDDGNEVILHTHFAVSENAQQLFGFIEKQDRELFRLLIKVNGVGPKMAVSIMSMDSATFVRCVMDNDVASLVKVPGVGKKTAERLIIEMRDKLKSWRAEGGSVPEANYAREATFGVNHNVAEAESALVALGYKPTEAAKAVARVLVDEPQSAEDIIRLALKSMLPV